MPTAIQIRRNIFDPRKAKQVMAASPAQNVRLAGALAPATTLAIDVEAFERIDVREYTKIGLALAATAGGQGTTLLDIFPMDANATQDDADSSVRILAAAATQDTLNAANAEFAYTTLDVSEFEYVEVAVTSGGVASDNTDIAWVDIFLS